MALKYFEASTMKDLYLQLDRWNDSIFTKDWDTTRRISWVEIQKEDNKFTCIASADSIMVQIKAADTLPVWVQGGKLGSIGDILSPVSINR